MKPGKRLFYVLLGLLAAILIAFGLLRSKYGPFLPPAIDKNLPDVIMFSAVGIMLWNRKVLGDEKKAEAARKLEEEEAAAARRAETAEPDADEGGDESGTDAPG
jgi:hypothetical protein